MTKLKSIQTFYKGHKFRSRLEARYAIFFDEIGWEWLYEFEGFHLKSGNYLPDFFLPKMDMFAEVKPKELNELEMKKCLELSNGEYTDGKKHKVILLEGSPSLKYYRMIIDGGIYDNIVPVAKGIKYSPYFVGNTDFPDDIFKLTQWAADEANMARFDNFLR